MTRRSLPEFWQGAKTVGAMFRAARERLGLSQNQVAELTAERGFAVSRSAVSEIERGSNLPGVESLVALCEVLHLEPREILERVLPPQGITPDLATGSFKELRRRAGLLFWNGQYRAATIVYAAMAEAVENETSLEPAERRRARAQIEVSRAICLRKCGDLRAAEEVLRRALHLASADDYAQTEALVVLSSIHSDEALISLAKAESEQAVCMAQAEGSDRLLAFAWTAKASCLFHSARLDEAAELYTRAIESATRTGDNNLQSNIQGNLGTCLLDLGHPSAALRRYASAVDLARKHGDRAGEAIWQIEFGRTALLLDEPDEAERRAAAALRIARANDNPFTVFCGVWLQYRIAQRRTPHKPDRQRIAHLKRLYARVAYRRSADVVREFRREILGIADA